jgi:hypothetical protein
MLTAVDLVEALTIKATAKKHEVGSWCLSDKCDLWKIQ